MDRYPRWIHHPEQGSVLVRSERQEANYRRAGGWYDDPSDFPKDDKHHHRHEHKHDAEFDGPSRDLIRKKHPQHVMAHSPSFRGAVPKGARTGGIHPPRLRGRSRGRKDEDDE